MWLVELVDAFYTLLLRLGGLLAKMPVMFLVLLLYQYFRRPQFVEDFVEFLVGPELILTIKFR